MNRKQINQKVISIINTKSPAAGAEELIQWQLQITDPQIKIWIQQPVLFIFENQHDWASIMKCVRSWKGLQQFQRGFYERMKKRINEPYDKNKNQIEIRLQLPKLIDKYCKLHPIKDPLLHNIEQYLIDSKSFKSSKSEISNANTKKPSNVFQNSLKTADLVAKKQQTAEKFPFPSIVIPSHSQKVQKLSEPALSQKSNSIQSRSSMLERPILRRPTLGTMPKRQGLLSIADKLPARNTKRLTFGGINNELNPINKKDQIPVQDRKKKKIQKLQVEQNYPKHYLIEEQKSLNNVNTNSNININNNKNSNDIKNINPEIKKNIFERKEQFIRVNPLINSQQKSIFQPNDSQDDKNSRSVSRSFTPHKQLVERKKVVIKTASQYEMQEDDDFDLSVKLDSSKSKADEFKSERKLSRKIELFNEEEEQLKKQLQKQQQNITQNLIKSGNGIFAQRKSYSFNRSSFLNKNQHKEILGPKPKLIFEKQQEKQIIRRENQLFSDLELSFFNFNLKENRDSQVNIYKLQKNLEYDLCGHFLDFMTKKIQDTKNERKRIAQSII